MLNISFCEAQLISHKFGDQGSKYPSIYDYELKNVKSYTEYSSFAPESKGGKKSHKVFDSNGRVLERGYQPTFGPYVTNIYEYDSDDKILSESSYQSGKRVEKIFKKYDFQGNLIEERIETYFKLDRELNMVPTKEDEKIEIRYYKYDSESNLISKSSSTCSFKPKEYGYENGNLIYEMEVGCDGSEILESLYLFQYDINGYLISERRFSWNGSVYPYNSGHLRDHTFYAYSEDYEKQHTITLSLLEDDFRYLFLENPNNGFYKSFPFKQGEDFVAEKFSFFVQSKKELIPFEPFIGNPLLHVLYVNDERTALVEAASQETAKFNPESRDFVVVSDDTNTIRTWVDDPPLVKTRNDKGIIVSSEFIKNDEVRIREYHYDENDRLLKATNQYNVSSQLVDYEYEYKHDSYGNPVEIKVFEARRAFKTKFYMVTTYEYEYF
ncbi:hypothetical protein [Ekhidna sp.]|uniref:hypothetical protein n=1 Tax=Ekhidna sp. TaxID=2608089 RepID=UPI003B5A05C1